MGDRRRVARQRAARVRWGAPVLVYPGGDYETFRPTWHSDQIEFGGRKGFIKLALEQGVPIVPVVAVGGQETALFVTRGERAARLTRWAELTRIKVSRSPSAPPFGVSLLDLPTRFRSPRRSPSRSSAGRPWGALRDERRARSHLPRDHRRDAGRALRAPGRADAAGRRLERHNWGGESGWRCRVQALRRSSSRRASAGSLSIVRRATRGRIGRCCGRSWCCWRPRVTATRRSLGGLG